MRIFERAIALYRAWRLRRREPVNQRGDEDVPTTADDIPTTTALTTPIGIAAFTVATPIATIARTGRLLLHLKTFIENETAARRTARDAQVCPDIVNGRRRLVSYTDGSRENIAGENRGDFNPSPGGYAVVHKVPGTNGTAWKEEAWDVENAVSALHTEVLAETEALAGMVDYVEQNDIRDADGRIFTDCQDSIQAIRRGIPSEAYTGHLLYDHIRPALLTLAQLSERFEQRGCTLEIRWVKRKTNAKHTIADALSREARTDPDSNLSPRSIATTGLDEAVEDAINNWYNARAELVSWDHNQSTKDLVARVRQLRRFETARIGPMNLDELLELRQKENWVLHLVN